MSKRSKGFVVLVLVLAATSAVHAAPPVCGDCVRTGGEACDGTDLSGQTCADFGCSGGALACTGSCTIDSSGCTGCGGGGGTPAGTVELLFTERSDDVSETNVSAAEQRLLDLLDQETVSIKA